MVKTIFQNPKMDMILVALDNSPASLSAAKMAIRIARSQRLMVYGLFVVDSQLVNNPSSDYQSELDHFQGTLSTSNLVIRLEEMGQKALKALKSACRKADVAVITEVVFGNVPETIQQKAEQSVLLALGRRGNGHRDDTQFLGHYFRSVCHTVRKPILVGGVEKGSLRRILIAAPNENGIRNAIDYIYLLKGLLMNDLVIAIKNELSNKLIKAPDQISFQNLPSDDLFTHLIGKSSDEIAAEANQQKVDLVMLAGYPPQNPLKWLVGSFTEQVIRGVQVPVLILNNPAS